MTKRDANGNEILLWYGLPVWITRLLLVVFILLSLVCGYAAFNYEELNPGGDEQWMKYFLYFLSAGFILGPIRPSNWTGLTLFYLTKSGVVVPDYHPTGRHTKWLTIPWERVNAVTEERYVGGHHGPCFWFKLTPEEIESHFRSNKLAKQFFNRDADPDNFSVGYIRQPGMPKEDVELIHQIKALYS